MRQAMMAMIVLALSGTGWAADLAPFSPPWDDASPGPTDLSGTLDKPAGKAGFVRVQDGHLYVGEQRLRLFGSNLTAGADFPDHETADKVAARMAKFGLNAVRFHFLDSTWGTPRLIKYDTGDWKNWDADTQDRLDYFIAKLKEHGIYANLNLLVGRRFGVGDGVDPKVNQLDWKAAHAVGFFHAPHMEAQKAYARQLLTHRNPYTKLTYVEDPAVALVEINNENGLIHTWMGGDFDALPDVFAQDLQKQWNDWLGKRYADTTALSKAWGARDEPLGAEQFVNATLAQNLDGWSVEQHQGAAVDASVENGTAILRVRKPGTAGGRQDWIRFLWETERKHWTGMQRFLKEELGVKAPIVGTIVATSTPNLMADLDVVDTHAYWEHPHFPGKPWDRNNWFVKNISMVDYPDGATVTRLAFQRVAGKPHMVSEYNHPAPNTHASEGPLFVAAFAALQDWDAIFLYTYSHDDTKTKAGRIPDFFDIGQHPTIMANVPVASLLFRRGDVAAAKQIVSVPLPPDKEIELIAQKGHAWGVLTVDQLGLDLKNAIRHRIALDVTGKAAATKLEAPAKEAVTSDSGEVTWRLPAKDQGVFEIRSPRTKGFIGHVDGQTLDLGDGVQVTVEKTRTGWCTLMLTLMEGESLDQKPRRALLVATGYAENTDMGWKDETKSTVGTNWGKPPSLVEPIAATLRIPRGAALPTVYPLDERGQRGTGVPSTAAGEGSAQIKIGPPHGTVWYEVTW